LALPLKIGVVAGKALKPPVTKMGFKAIRQLAHVSPLPYTAGIEEQARRHHDRRAGSLTAHAGFRALK
jgi:hypothetical protein